MLLRHLPTRFAPLRRPFSVAAAAAAAVKPVDPYVHSGVSSRCVPTGVVPLAYRRSVLGLSDATLKRVRADEEPPVVDTSARRVPLLLAHCLLGDGRSMNLLEAQLHAALRKTNEDATSTRPIVLDVYNVDLRNHGWSDHAEAHDYTQLVADLQFFVQTHQLDRPVMCGHSQGGKAILAYALSRMADSLTPRGLISLDAAPAMYTHTHSTIFRAMQSLDLADPALVQQRDVEHALKPHLPSPSDRAFVIGNIEQRTTTATANDDSKKRWMWRPNVAVLEREEKNVHGWPIPAPSTTDAGANASPCYPHPALFIGGGKSTRLTTAAYVRHLGAYFPRHRVEMLPTAAHFVHQSHARECAAWIEKCVREWA